MSARRSDGPRPSRARGRTVLWLMLLLAVVVMVGWAVGSNAIRGGGGDEAAQPTETAPPPIPFTIPEGLRREDTAALISDEIGPERPTLQSDDYLNLTKPSTRGQRLAGADEPVSLEGFLFPKTYDIGTETTAKILVDAQVREYRQLTNSINYRYAKQRNLTEYDVLIIASMIEREVQADPERKLVASVIYNRLRNGMPLAIDATVQYALGEWKNQLTQSDLAVDSPYNTRVFAGLPPGPIANPGEASLRAAARPKETDFLFYVARNDGSGRHYFSRTEAEHLANVERARAAGGDSF